VLLWVRHPGLTSLAWPLPSAHFPFGFIHKPDTKDPWAHSIPVTPLLSMSGPDLGQCHPNWMWVAGLQYLTAHI
jgi:hypothetical protein